MPALPVTEPDYTTPVGWYDDKGTPHANEATLPGEGYYNNVQHVTVTPAPIPATNASLTDLYLGGGEASNSTIKPVEQSSTPLTDSYLSDNDINKYGMETMYKAPDNEPSQQQGIIANTASGVAQGVKDVVNTVGSGIGYLDKAISKITGGAGADRADAMQQYIDQQNQTYEKQVGDSTAASIGRVVGQLLATAPLAEFGGAAKAASLASKLPTIIQPLARTAIAGTVVGGEFGAATNASNNQGIVSNVTQNALGGAVAGPVMGAIGSGVSKLIPATKSLWATVGPIRDLANQAGAPASSVKNVIDILENAGYTPKTAQAALTKIGPQATLADLDPSIATELGGLATLGGKPTAIAKGRMQTRADTANSNAVNTMTTKLGPKPDLDAVKADIVDKAQKAVAPDYDSAYKSGNSLDAKPIVSDIRNQLTTAVGEKEKALKAIGSYFLRKDKTGQFTDQIKDTIPELHEVRIGIDAILNSKNPTTSLGNITKSKLQDIRGKVDDLLKSNPQMKAADEKFAEKMDVKNAVDYGHEALQRGTGSKEEFEVKFKAASAEKQEAIRKGIAGYIHSQMDEATKGALPEAQRIFGKGSKNRAILKTAFGSKADKVLDTLTNEATQRATERGVLSRSHTGEGQQIQRKYGEAPKPGIGQELAHGMMVDLAGGHGAASVYMAGKKALNYAGGRVINYSKNSHKALIEGTTDILSRSGLPIQTTLKSMDKVGRIQKAVLRNNPKVKLPIALMPVIGKPIINAAQAGYKKVIGER